MRATTYVWDFLESKLFAYSWVERGQAAWHIWQESGLPRRCCARCSEHVDSICEIGPSRTARSTRAAHKQDRMAKISPLLQLPSCSDCSDCAGRKVCPNLACGQENIFPGDLRCVVAEEKLWVFIPAIYS